MSHSPAFLILAAIAGVVAPASAQSPAPRPYGRVSFYMTSDRRTAKDGEAKTVYESATAFTFRTPDADSSGVEAGIDLRHTSYSVAGRPQRVSVYDGFAGMRLGGRGQFRVRGGHMWLPDLGTAGALAGGVVEYRTARSDADNRLIAGGFAGAEPLGYEAGYAPGVRKYGGYLALESGFLRRHVVGVANVSRAQSRNGQCSPSPTTYRPADRFSRIRRSNTTSRAPRVARGGADSLTSC